MHEFRVGDRVRIKKSEDLILGLHFMTGTVISITDDFCEIRCDCSYRSIALDNLERTVTLNKKYFTHADRNINSLSKPELITEKEMELFVYSAEVLKKAYSNTKEILDGYIMSLQNELYARYYEQINVLNSAFKLGVEIKKYSNNDQILSYIAIEQADPEKAFNVYKNRLKINLTANEPVKDANGKIEQYIYNEIEFSIENGTWATIHDQWFRFITSFSYNAETKILSLTTEDQVWEIDMEISDSTPILVKKGN